MAITNAQQYKQLLAKGGRIGLANGSRMDSGEAREARGDKSDFGGRDERRPDMLGVSRAVEATNKPKEQPNLLKALGLVKINSKDNYEKNFIKFSEEKDKFTNKELFFCNYILLKLIGHTYYLYEKVFRS